jgi:hypothetical protein
VTDIFQEVEEDVRRERFEKLWKQYGDYIIAGVAALAVGVAGYKLWDKYQYQQRLEASKTFMQAVQAADTGNVQAATATYGKLVKSGPGGYAIVAKLGQANSQLATDNRSEALTIYKSVADKDSSQLGAVARIRAAWIMVESAPKSDLEAWLAPLNVQSNPWHFMAREIMAYADYRAGALAVAGTEYRQLADDKDAPSGLRGRANAMAIFIKAGGDKNFGTVPKPAAPQLPAGVPPELQQQIQQAIQQQQQGQPAPQGQPKP